MDNKRIAELAIETRTHIVEALNGLDEIIKLAEAVGRDDIVATAKQARQPVAKAAKTFNGQVAENNGDATKIDPVVLDEANAASTKAKKTTEELIKELEKKVDANKKEADSAFALLGLDFQAGKARVIEDGWTHNVNSGLKDHQERIERLENNVGRAGEDGTFVFADSFIERVDNVAPFSFNSPTGGLIGLIAVIIALAFFLITGSEFGVALFWSIMLGMGALAIGGFITAPHNKHKN